MSGMCKLSIGVCIKTGCDTENVVQYDLCHLFFFCNLFIFKEKIQIQKHMTCIYNLHRRNIFNLSKQTFCNITLKFQKPRTISNGNHFLHIYSLCVEDRKFKVIFSILMQYFRYFRPPLILGLSPKHLHLYK